MSATDSKSDEPRAAFGRSVRPAQNLVGSIRSTDAALRERTFVGMHQHRRRWFDFIWLIYSVFFFIQPVERNSRPYWVQFAVVYVVFLALYVGVIYARSRRTAYLFLAGLAVLGVWYFPINLSASGIVVYVVALAPFVTDSLAVCIGIFISISGALIAEGLLLHVNPWAWGFPLFICLAVGSANTVAAQRMRANQKLSLAQEEIEHLAKVAERERIARDLHDVLGHTLSLVVLKSELAGKLLDHNPERAGKEIHEVEQIARTALAEVREAIRGYRAEGLAAELDRARATLDAAGVTLDCASSAPKMLPAQETVLSLIVREAVTNIVRHAHASHCHISLEQRGRQIVLGIEDDGRGGIRQEGNGLRGMRERVESIEGRFHILSENGTRLVIEVPA
ncbi:sensor histidine kinase [Occallatibacter riparius]|uniref:Sensor histidine kinase n=1 Tax=Occallatibacter riparius TaxID=1002689 RepID=A0A9J7BHQ5_9BACT|nr:sensor histidine kinase [Occallatibacter riparius]UWZ81971.1 sensor histidine kinase [Occallatibacter riparius]